MGLFDIGNKSIMHVAGVKQSRFIEPHDCKEITKSRVKYANADKMASEMPDFSDQNRIFAIVDGKFIFGDFIEALIVRNNWLVDDLTISTLSMSQDNIDSLANLCNGGYVKSLNLVVSHYYFATERHSLMPYLYETLDIGNKLQLSVASVHTKIAMIKTSCGKKITIHGSANLRSSGNIEQFTIENDIEIYDFNYEVHSSIIERHKTIKKELRGKQLWQAVLAVQESHQDSNHTGKTKRQLKEEAHSAAKSAGI